MRKSSLAVHVTLALVALALAGRAGDWAQWRGPDGSGRTDDGMFDGGALEGGARVLWRAAVGRGYSACSIEGDRVYTMGNESDTDTVYCLDAATGDVVWKHTYKCKGGSYPGPRATPVVDGDRLYTVSREGDVLCLDKTAGKVNWQVNVAREYGAGAPKWGHSASVIVLDNMLLLNAGPSGLALDKLSGRKIWSSGEGVCGYAAPVVFEQGGRRLAAIFSETALQLVAVDDGEHFWSCEWRTSYDVNAADPVFHDGGLLISSGYRRGCAVLRVNPERWAVLWENKALQSHFSSPILIDGFVYGIDGNAGRGDLVCVEWQTGEVKWRGDTGFGSLIAVGDKLVVLNERGDLSVVEAQPESFSLVSSASGILGKTCWTSPTFSRGRLLCRNHQGDVVCVDMSGRGKAE
jgi:outer membrane protein assembly factor BamB